MKKAANGRDNERGSLALEQVLFIGAIIAMGAGLFVFYQNMGSYFENFTVTGPAGTGDAQNPNP